MPPYMLYVLTCFMPFHIWVWKAKMLEAMGSRSNSCFFSLLANVYPPFLSTGHVNFR